MSLHITPFDFSASSKYTKLLYSAVYPLVYSIWDDSDYLWHLEEYIIPEISGFHSWKPWDEMLVIQSKRTANVRILCCFSSFPFSSCDKTDLRFPQPPKQKHLWESERILKINLDYHFFPPQLLNFSCIFLSSAKAYQLLGHLDVSKMVRITELNISRLDRDLFIQTKKKKISDEKITSNSQWRKKWPIFACKFC